MTTEDAIQTLIELRDTFMSRRTYGKGGPFPQAVDFAIQHLQGLNTIRDLASRIEAEAEPLEGDYAGYASVSIDDIKKLVAVLGPPNFPYGCEHMTIDAFKAAVKAGVFTDDDGHGNYASETTVSKFTVYPSDVRHNNLDSRFTHVVWFNK